MYKKIPKSPVQKLTDALRASEDALRASEDALRDSKDAIRASKDVIRASQAHTLGVSTINIQKEIPQEKVGKTSSVKNVRKV